MSIHNITEFMRHIALGGTPNKGDYDEFDIPERLRPEIDSHIGGLHALNASGNRKGAQDTADNIAAGMIRTLTPSEQPPTKKYNPTELAAAIRN